MKRGLRWKDNFAESEFWKHNIAGNSNPCQSKNSDGHTISSAKLLRFHGERPLFFGFWSEMLHECGSEELNCYYAIRKNGNIWKHTFAKAAKIWV